MLAGPYGHIIGGRHIDDGRFVGVAVRDPYCYRKLILTSAKVDGKCAVEVQEQCGHAIFRCWFSRSAVCQEDGDESRKRATYCRRLYGAQRLGIARVSVQGLNMPVEDLGIPESLSFGQIVDRVAYPSQDVPKPVQGLLRYSSHCLMMPTRPSLDVLSRSSGMTRDIIDAAAV